MHPRKILVAFDGSENALRALDYVGAIAGKTGDFEIELLHVERLPDPDMFPTTAEWQARVDEQEASARAMLARGVARLEGLGVRRREIFDNYLSCRLNEADAEGRACSIGVSIAAEVLRRQEQGGFGTVVVGRRGVTKQQEFLFGSVSNKIVHDAQGCTVWVVE